MTIEFYESKEFATRQKKMWEKARGDAKQNKLNVQKKVSIQRMRNGDGIFSFFISLNADLCKKIFHFRTLAIPRFACNFKLNNIEKCFIACIRASIVCYFQIETEIDKLELKDNLRNQSISFYKTNKHPIDWIHATKGTSIIIIVVVVVGVQCLPHLNYL